MFTVTVNDTERPVPSCPGNLTVSTAPGQCATNASFAFSFTDNCPGGSTLCVPASGSSFAKGTNSVTCTATDASGNSSNCTFTVTVTDTERPVPSCPGNLTVSTAPGQCATNASFAFSFTDNCPEIGRASCRDCGSSFAKGTNTVTCTATDASGNNSNCTFTVTVNDTERPVPNCPGNLTVSTAPGQCASNASFAFSFTDNCPGGSIDRKSAV